MEGEKRENSVRISIRPKVLLQQFIIICVKLLFIVNTIYSECGSLKLVTENTVPMGLSFMRTAGSGRFTIIVMIESGRTNASKLYSNKWINNWNLIGISVFGIAVTIYGSHCSCVVRKWRDRSAYLCIRKLFVVFRYELFNFNQFNVRRLEKMTNSQLHTNYLIVMK